MLQLEDFARTVSWFEFHPFLFFLSFFFFLHQFLGWWSCWFGGERRKSLTQGEKNRNLEGPVPTTVHIYEFYRIREFFCAEWCLYIYKLGLGSLNPQMDTTHTMFTTYFNHFLLLIKWYLLPICICSVRTKWQASHPTLLRSKGKSSDTHTHTHTLHRLSSTCSSEFLNFYPSIPVK